MTEVSKLTVDFPLEESEVQEVLSEGTDLREYSTQVERQLRDVENQSINDYINESQNIVSLHRRIVSCDDILQRMEKMLIGFQSDLGSISSEIVYLQRKSIRMSQELHNRQAVRGHLSQFIDDMAVPELLIMTVLEANVTDKEFLNQLSILNHKINFVKEQQSAGVKCCEDVREVLDKLKVKAVVKIRAHLLEQISRFRRPMTNYQVPQNSMLKHRVLYEFVLSHERTAAQEIRAEYVDTMAKIYFSYFKSYTSSLNKLMFEEQAGKEDLMGVEEGGSRGLFHKSGSLRNRNTVFTIGQRGEVLTSLLQAPIIIPHSAVKADARHPYEALFRSQQYALVDNACREYLFICEFFVIKDSGAVQLFSQIMDKTLNLLRKNLEVYVSTCYDCIALLLCVQLVLRYQMLCHKRAIPALDPYWQGLEDIIWPRFELVFKMNIHSIKSSDPTKFSKEMKPHYITRRYAEFTSAMVSMSESYPSEVVSRLVAQLMEQVENFILRMAAVFPHRIHQLIFLINNYDLALGILMERVRECREAEGLSRRLAARSSEYVEEVLSPHIGGIMQFVKEGESLQERGLPDQLKQLQGKAGALVEQFSRNWKESVEQLSREIVPVFPSLVTGSSLLQLSLASLLQYYERFHKLLSPQARAALVNIHHIKIELKKYKTNFS